MIFNILLAIIGLIVGLGLGLMVAKPRREKEIAGAQSSAAGITDSARKETETLKKEALLEAKEGNQKHRSEVESELRESRLESKPQENRSIQHEQTLNHKDDSLEKRENSLKSKEEALSPKQQLIKEREKDVKKVVEDQQKELERTAGLPKEDARGVIMKSTKEELNHELTLIVREFEQCAKEEVDRKAKNLLSLAIQHCAANQVSEMIVSVVTPPNDEMKGRIIGREDRNTRTSETLTGIDLIIDDTPEAVVLSGFDPTRREVARMTLEKLTQDGRIHPTRIEEMVEKFRKEMDERIRKYGEEVAFEVSVYTLHSDLIRIIGRLQSRISYGQNVLKHSVEVAKLAGISAVELGEDIQLARRAELLHDTGKAFDHEIEGSYVEIGAELVARYKENPVIINAIAFHHGDVEVIPVISVSAAAADVLSAARPGAQSKSLENYICRLRSLENTSNSFAGVESNYAVQAGCGVWVTVRPEKISDLDTARLARDICKRIEEELDYPGHIKAIVIRETRAVDYAK